LNALAYDYNPQIVCSVRHLIVAFTHQITAPKQIAPSHCKKSVVIALPQIASFFLIILG
jgi:uncharacterized protein (DUF2336 family)